MAGDDSAPVSGTSGMEGWLHNFKFGGALEWTRRYEKPGRALRLAAEASFSNELKEDVWQSGHLSISDDFSDDDYVVESSWRLTPEYKSDLVFVSGKYSDKDFCGAKGLDVDFSLDARLGENRDANSAATLVGEVWVDSTSYRENYHYISLTVNPTLHAVWTTGGLSLEATITPQYFTDLLTSSSDTESYGKSRLDVLSNVSGKLSLGGGHSLNLAFSRGVKRPDYLNLCRIPRQGALQGELIIGNPELDPSVKNKVEAGYKFAVGSFSTGLQLGYEYEKDNIEYTFNEVDVDGETWRIYTWINAGWSETASARITLGWDSGALKAGLYGDLKYYKGVTSSGSESRSFDYKIGGDASYSLGSGWKFLVRGHYQSDIIRSYNSITSYIGCDVRVDKKFGMKKRFGLFAEGRDLFDKAIVSNTYSEDFSYNRSINYDYNRRIFLLGATFSF